MKQVALWFLDIYQKFFTILGYGSCRYYPTCSEYAKWQFEKNNLIYALFFTIVRILKCNQLFSGGFDYPILHKSTKCKKNLICNHDFNKIIVKFWLIKKEENRFFLIKSFKKV